MAEQLELLLKISIVVFMVGNLLAMGLVVKLRQALAGLRDRRFVILSVITGFVVGPGLAYLIAMLIPMEEPYRIGLILLGMTPCAPFLPMVVDRARGDIGYTAAYMLLISVITVLYMPLAVPLLTEGLTADAWTIAKPLLLIIFLPMAIGVSIQTASESTASRLHPFIKKVTGLVTIVMLALCVVVYWQGFIDAIGTYAIGSQVLFLIIATAVSHALGFGLARGERSVVTLGMSTRNLGAAFAPLFAVASVDERAIIMVALGVPIQVIWAFLVAMRIGRSADAA